MFKPFLLQKKQFTLNALGITNRIPTPKFKNNVICTAVQSDGKILVGGSFIDYGNTTNRSYLIRLNSDNTLDTTFCVAASDGKFSGSIYSIVVQSDGKILVGGAFLNYPGAVNRNYLIRLNNDGTTDNDFCVAASDGGKFNTAVWSIAVQPDNKILVGGDFTNYPGATNRNRFIRLDSNGLVDNDFCVAASDGSKFNGRITSIAVQSDGKILVGGNFFTYPGGTNRSYLIRLNNNGTTDNPFCVNAVDGKFNNSISSVLIVSGVGIYVAGSFTEKVRLIDQTSGLTISDLPINLRPSSIIPTTTVSQYTNNSLFIGSNPNNQVYGALISLDRLYNII